MLKIDYVICTRLVRLSLFFYELKKWFLIIKKSQLQLRGKLDKYLIINYYKTTIYITDHVTSNWGMKSQSFVYDL